MKPPMPRTQELSMGKVHYKELKDALEMLDINPHEFWDVANRVKGQFPNLTERKGEVNERIVKLILGGEDDK